MDDILQIIEASESPQIAAERIEALRPTATLLVGLEGVLTTLLKHDALKFDSGTFELSRGLSDDEVKLITETSELLAIKTDELNGYGNWVLGNMICILKEHGYEPENFFTHIHINRLFQAEKTFTVFRKKRFQIPYTHHRDIACTAHISEKDQHLIADYAERHALNQRDLRKILAYARAARKAETEPILTDEAIGKAITAEPRPSKPKRYVIFSGGRTEVVPQDTGDDWPEEATHCFQGSVKWFRGEPQPRGAPAALKPLEEVTDPAEVPSPDDET